MYIYYIHKYIYVIIIIYQCLLDELYTYNIRIYVYKVGHEKHIVLFIQFETPITFILFQSLNTREKER